MHCLKLYGRALRLCGSYARGRKRPWHVIVDFSSLSYSYNIRNVAFGPRRCPDMHAQGRLRAEVGGPASGSSAYQCSLRYVVSCPCPMSWSTSTSSSSSPSSLWASWQPRCSSHKLSVSENLNYPNIRYEFSLFNCRVGGGGAAVAGAIAALPER